MTEFWRRFGIAIQVRESSLYQRQKNPQEESQHGSANDNKSTLWEGAPVGWDRGVNHLNDGALFGFIQFGEFELPRKNFENCFVVFHVTQFAHVLEPSRWDLTFRHQETLVDVSGSA